MNLVSDAERPLRRDAARNRELILETAAEVFAEQGIEAGYDEIARRAGVGVGTVYRRFPERTELVQALFESRIAEIVAIAEESAAMPQAWDGLAHFLERALERQASNRGLKELMGQVADGERVSAGKQRLAPLLNDLVDRAKREGALRGDVAASDLGVHLMAMSSMTCEAQPDLWRRYLAVLLDGLRAESATRSLPLCPPDDRVMHEVSLRLHGRC